MTRNPQNWLRNCAIGLSERVEDRGLSLSVDAAETFLAERHITAAEHLGISPRAARQFLDDAALDELADRLVADFADEAPGGDLFSLPRTATITVTSFGRLVAALAETIQFYWQYAAIDDADRSARIHEIAQLLSLAGLIQSQSDDPTQHGIIAPPAMFTRIARILDTAAALTHNQDLGRTLAADSARARAAAHSDRPPTGLRSV